jgi:hypothetical protein
MLAAGVAVLIDPTSPVAAIGIFALIGFHLIVGWTVDRVSTVVLSAHDRWAGTAGTRGRG